MRRLLTLAVATGIVMALAAGPTAAQEINLGFEIDPVEGNVGDTVDGLVNLDDFNQVCFTTPEELGADSAAKINEFLGAYQAANPNPGDWTAEQTAGFTVLTFFAILAAGPTGGDPDVPTLLFSNSTIIAFVDIAALGLIGERGSFDPATGEGSVVVPDVPPGPQTVAAVCIEMLDPAENYDAYEAALLGAGAIATQDPPPEDIFAELEGVLFGLFTFRGIGVAGYCVLDEAGECPQDVVPVDPPGNGEEPAAAVTAAPRFTG